MQPEHIFLIIWTILAVCMISMFLVKGRRALSIFPKLEESKFEYIENSLSGYSTQSIETRMGGARKVLRLRVTKNQLWLTTNIFMAWIAEQFDLLHIIPIESLNYVGANEEKVILEFIRNGRIKKIVIISKRQNELVKMLNNKMDECKKM